MFDLPTEAAALAEHLRGLTNEQLSELETELVAAFDDNFGDGTPTDLAVLNQLADQINAVRENITARVAEAEAQAEQARALRELVHANDAQATTEEQEAQPESAPQAPEAEAEALPSEENQVETPELEPLAASIARAIDAAVARRTVPVEDVIRDSKPSLNRHLRLGQVAQHAPAAQAPEGKRSVFAASADIPGFTQGGAIRDMDSLVTAMHSRARALPISRTGVGSPVIVASMNREFRYRLDLDATPEQVDNVLRAAFDTEALVAAGGWCAPSEISYDFFNIVCEDGMLDLPTVGVVNRGGIRWPTSPTFADITAASPDGLWTWTEDDDIAAVTGSPTKDCVRIDCPDFNEERLVCEGLCVTAGNLIDYAYPEAVANYIRLVMAARAHLTNTRIIGLLTSNSTAVTMAGPTGGFTGDLFNAIDLQAYDYRNKFAMCDDAILEVVLPQWVFGPLRSDWMRRTGVEDPNLATATIMNWFDARNVRVQFVQDWQVRASGQPGFSTAQTNWPTTVQFMIYAPGTFLRGQGLRLDLGVVRDSVLNETNDHTAAWMEDCYLVAKAGHESRLVTTNLCVDGSTGAADIACA